MTRHLYLVFSNPAPGREDGFNDWYDNTHLKDVMNVEGFEAAQRFALSNTDPAQTHQYRYLAVYEVSDVDVARKALVETREERNRSMPPGIMEDDRMSLWMSAASDRVEAS